MGGSCLRPGGCDRVPGRPGYQFGPLPGPALGLGGVSGGGFGRVLVSFPGSGLPGGQVGGHVPGRLIGGFASRHHARGRSRPTGADHPDPWL